MIKKILAFFAAMSMLAAFAAVDVNKASEAELDGVKGIGPAKSKLIVAERKKGEFKNWDDLISRVKGMGEATAAKLSAEGLTVGGASYKTAAKDAKPAAKADMKADAKADSKTLAKAEPKDAKPAAAVKPEAKPEAAKK